jgi:hypothetical protein
MTYQNRDHHLHLPDINDNGHTPLRQWRYDNDLTPKDVSAQLGCSIASLFRYEVGEALTIPTANRIVQLTHGKVRYRDLLGGFRPEYA